MDELGAGYSSLTLLEKLRPDFVKPDRNLIGGVDCDGFKAVIAQKLLETARNLNIATVAERVETAGEWNWLRARRRSGTGLLLRAPSSHAARVQSMERRDFGELAKGICGF